MRDKMFTMRMNLDEREKLEILARSMGLTPSKFIRGIINGEIGRAPTKDELDLYVERIRKTIRP